MPHQRNQGQGGYPTYTQAAKVVARFGGEANLARMIGVSRITVYRWQYRRPYGCDGLIPTIQVDKIKRVAREQGILLRAEDWLPERATYDERPQAMAVRRFTRPSKVGVNRRTLADLLS